MRTMSKHQRVTLLVSCERKKVHTDKEMAIGEGSNSSSCYPINNTDMGYTFTHTHTHTCPHAQNTHATINSYIQKNIIAHNYIYRSALKAEVGP